MLSAEVLLEARSLQRVSLSHAYQRAFQKCKEFVGQSQLELSRVISPIQGKRNCLDHEIEILALQMSCLERYTEVESTIEQRQSWQEHYKRELDLLREEFIKDYAVLVNEREAIYREDRLFSLCSKEEKLQEIKRFERALDCDEIPIYRGFVLPETMALAKALFLTKKRQREASLETYEMLMEIQTAFTVEFYAKVQKQESIVKTLKEQSEDTTEQINPIYSLCRQGNLYDLKKFLEQQPDPRNYLAKQAPRLLHLACELNQWIFIHYLIGELHVQQRPDEQGYYPIHYLSMYEHEGTVGYLNYLRDHGAMVDVLGSYGRSPLHTATLYGNLSATQWLLDEGSDINRLETGRFQSNTPLHNASFAGHSKIVSYLLARGANPRLLSKGKKTPLMEAIIQEKPEIARLFLSSGYWLSENDRQQLRSNIPLTSGVRRCLALHVEEALKYAANPLGTQEDQQLLEGNSANLIERKAWHFEGKPNFQEMDGGYQLLVASEADIQKVLSCYEHNPVPGYDVQKVEVIYNSSMNRSFSLNMQMLQARDGNDAFAPHWSQETESGWRQTIHQQWQTLAAPYQDSDYPAVKLMPLWHGTKPEVLESIFTAGYANLANTDAGFYGKGIYSAHEARYAYRLYSKGALILNWVATYSVYPVIRSDMPKLAERGNYRNYDAHFIPVVPQDLSETVYRATDPGENQHYTEVVVFEKVQCLPRYLVTLQTTLPRRLSTVAQTFPSALSAALASGSEHALESDPTSQIGSSLVEPAIVDETLVGDGLLGRTYRVQEQLQILALEETWSNVNIEDMLVPASPVLSAYTFSQRSRTDLEENLTSFQVTERAAFGP